MSVMEILIEPGLQIVLLATPVLSKYADIGIFARPYLGFPIFYLQVRFKYPIIF